MTSPIAWLDHSELDRRRTNELLRQFEEKDTVDELGIGQIRDALSDRLFPGTSIIQTRARYFLFIPWMYQELERKRVRADRVEKTARDDELGLIAPLSESDDPAGTIGRIAGKDLKTLPSAIYWQGLRAWGIRGFAGNRAAYHASLTDGYYRRLSSGRSSREEPSADPVLRSWHAGLPEPPGDFPAQARHALTHAEAAYLAERIKQTNPTSLLAHLVTECSSDDENPTAWEHADIGTFPAHNLRELTHAENFSRVIHGASLLYNLVLSELKKNSEWTKRYRERLDGWQAGIEQRKATFRDWNLGEFWVLVAEENPAVSPMARDFVTRWIDLVISRGQTAATSADCRQLVINRERAIKGKLARVESPRALEVWQGASGAGQLDYRWSNIARQLVKDIHTGLASTDA